MESRKLRGFVSPEEFNGSAAERIQEALDTAEKEDIRKVVIDGNYLVDQTLYIPPLTEVVLKEKALVVMTGEGPLFKNRVASQEGKNSWSFEDKRIYLKGEEGAVLRGDLSFYHAKFVVLESLKIQGTVSYEFCREIRMEHDEITGKENAIVIGRGCNNFIMQYLKLEAKETAVLVDTRLECGAYVLGKDSEIHEIIFRDSELKAATGIRLGASEEFGLFNIQIDHHNCSGKGIVIGDGLGLPAERFFNITATDLKTGGEERVLENEVRHCWFGE